MNDTPTNEQPSEPRDAAAQFTLGVSYEKGEGVPQDHAKAVEWFRKAADQGHAEAQFNLGERYADGVGVEQDDAKAFEWFLVSAAVYFDNTTQEWKKGNADAQFRLGVLYRAADVSGAADVTECTESAVYWFCEAAKQGHAQAQCILREMFYDKYGTRYAYEKVVEWFCKVAEQGDADAQFNLGELYNEGDDVPQDFAEAAKWYSKAAEQGHAHAQSWLGTMYYYGDGVPKDALESVKRSEERRVGKECKHWCRSRWSPYH